MRYVLGLLLFGLSLTLSAADYAREKRWAEDVTTMLFYGEPVYLKAAGREFLTLMISADNAQTGVILVHGMGVHPDWGLIGKLRVQLAEQAYTTLSIQMPVLAADATLADYTPSFAEADARLAASVDYLTAKGYKKIVLICHSLGARMSNHYLGVQGDPRINAWIVIGLTEFEYTHKLNLPILDLYGENDFPLVISKAAKRAQVLKKLPGGRQHMLPKADHFFTGQEAPLLKSVQEFLASLS